MLKKVCINYSELVSTGRKIEDSVGRGELEPPRTVMLTVRTHEQRTLRSGSSISLREATVKIVSLGFVFVAKNLAHGGIRVARRFKNS